MGSGFEEYRTTIDSAQEYLARADDLDGFLFAVRDGEDLNAVIGKNDTKEGSLWLDQPLGVLVLLTANSHDIHPAEIGHMAVQFVAQQEQ